jgi:hypothetical protein
MTDDFENIGASYVPGTEEAYRELVRKADLLRRGQMSEQQVEAAFDDIVGTALEQDDVEGYVPEAKDEKIEDLFQTLAKQVKKRVFCFKNIYNSFLYVGERYGTTS